MPFKSFVPLCPPNTSSAVNEASSHLDIDIIEVMRISRPETARGVNGSLIGEISSEPQYNATAVVNTSSLSEVSHSNLSVDMTSNGPDLILASPEKECSSPAHNVCRVMHMQEVRIIRFLGEGTTGKVYFAKDQVSRASLALKVVEKEGKSEYILSTIEQEVDIMHRLSDSPWFVQLYSSWHDHDNMYIAMTPYPSDLDSELIRLVKIEPVRARFYMAEIIIALTELHKRGIIHRDVKAPNILIDCQGHVVLADFGLSMDFYHPPSIAERVYQPYWPYLSDEYADSNTEERDPSELYFVAWDYRGSELEMAPEIHLGQPYSFGIDFWSAAVVLYWMLTGRPPWYEREDCSDIRIEVGDKPLAFKIAEDDLVFLPSDEVDEVTQDFLQKMLVKNPKKRLMIDFEMPNHPYFTGINWPLMEARKIRPHWVPKYDICHVYEPNTPVCTLGKPYSEYEDRWPSFAHLSKEASKRYIWENCDDINSDTDKEFGPNSVSDNSQDTGKSENIVFESSAVCVNSDTNATEKNTSIVAGTLTSPNDTILPTTPKQNAPEKNQWNVTITSPPPEVPYNPRPQQWLHAQDLLGRRYKQPTPIASSATSISSLEIMYVSAQPPGVSDDQGETRHVNSTIFPQSRVPATNGTGLLSKAKAWWMSKTWTPKPRKSMGVKWLSCYKQLL